MGLVCCVEVGYQALSLTVVMTAMGRVPPDRRRSAFDCFWSLAGAAIPEINATLLTVRLLG